MRSDEQALIGRGGHGGGHGRGHRGGGVYAPWWPLYYDDDPDDILDEDRTDRLAEAVARKLVEKKAPSITEESSSLDLLGAETFTGADWLNVLKNTAGDIVSPGAASQKAKVESRPTEKPASSWPWALGGALVGGFVGFFLRRG